MTATTSERNTRRRNADDFSFPVGASKKILAGTIVMLGSGGFAEPGATATGKKCVGVAERTADNSGGADGAVDVAVKRGCFQFANSASTDEIKRADIGANAYIVDNQTVAKTDGSSARSVAGVIRDVDAQGVWVQF